MKERDYSLQRYRRAEAAGQEDLPMAEAAFLKKHYEVEDEQLRRFEQSLKELGHSPSGVTAAASTGFLMMLFDAEQRNAFLSRWKVWTLERQRLDTIASQLDAAEREAKQANEEYDRREKAMGAAIQDFAGFVKNNRREPVELTHEEREFLQRYERIERGMNQALQDDLDKGPSSPNSGPIEMGIGHAILNLLDPEGRWAIKNRSKAEQLQAKQQGTLTYLEERKVEKEQNRLGKKMLKAIESFLEFRRAANEKNLL